MIRRAKFLEYCPTGVFIVAVLATCVWAQQPSPATPVQPLGEAEVARQFEEQAPELFRQWVERRPTELRALALGQWNDTDQSSAVSCPRETSFAFYECEDVEKPAKYKINVRKTDSILTPYIGELFVNVKVHCRVRSLFPAGFTFSLDKFREEAALLKNNCIGKSYDECLKAGAKPREKHGFFGCSGAELNFTYDHEAHLTYRWSHEKWEFQEESGSAPSRKGGAEKD